MKKFLIAFMLLLSIASNEKIKGNAMQRSAQYPIESIVLNRWSARAMSGESISEKELMTLFEAARWAPSSYNGQPWRFIYAKRDTSQWQTFFDLMVPFNQGWAKDAAVLILIVSKNTFDHNGKFSRTHSFDAGSAWQNLALQGVHMGLVVHAMSGFDYDKAKQDLNIPDGYTVEAMIAVGKPGDINKLDDEMQKREKIRSGRKEIKEFIFEGFFQPK